MNQTITAANATARSPLGLLVRIHLRQTLRRLGAIRQQSRLLTAVILVFILGYWVSSFWLFWQGLRFVGTFPGLGGLLTERLMYLLFVFLMVLLVFSNVITAYTGFFRNRETGFLLSQPLSAETVCRWKLLESALLASWAFLFLVAPLLAAYGWANHVRWHFYLVTPLMIALFILLPAMMGAWFAVALGRYLDRRSFQVALGLLLAGLIGVTRFWVRPETITDEMLETRVLSVLDRLLIKTQFSQFPALPSYWLSTAVLNWADGAMVTAAFFILVLLSYVLFFGHLTWLRLGAPFYEASSAVHSRTSLWQHWRSRPAPVRAHERSARGRLDAILGLCRWWRVDTRALIAKDIRLFWRDTTQWGQTLMLFGLWGVYLINLRTFSHQLNHPFWIHLVSYLNLLVCSLNLATLTTRFVFPQFSLEGKRLWIIGLAPLGLTRIVQAKFWLASGASLLVTLGLTCFSCHVLGLAWSRGWFFCGAITLMTFALTGLAVGLGVLYPNFKEENPSKIVNGFGGTFCLVASFFYILGSVLLLTAGSPWLHAPEQALAWSLVGWGGFVLLSAVVGGLPMGLAHWRLGNFEI